MLDKLLRHLRGTASVPQSEPLDRRQVRNSAGGFTYALSDLDRLDRFLILGSEGGTYYASERALTRSNAAVVERLLAVDGLAVVARVVTLREEDRLPKLGPALLALAMALKLGDLPTRRAAAEAVPRVARTHTQLFQLATAVQVMGGWGRVTQRAFAKWYTDMDARKVAYQAVKYQFREGWAGRDVLRMAHPRPPSSDHDAVFRWMVNGWVGELPEQAPEDATRLLWAVEQARRAEDVGSIVTLIREHDLVRESIPTRFLNAPEVWEALLHSGRGMPMTAMLRNLAKMTAVGVLAPLSEPARFVAERLTDAEALRRARVHPIQVLSALRVYGRGRGVRGRLSWQPVGEIVDALDAAFGLAFGHIEPTGKRTLLALDVSGSMSWSEIAGVPGLTPREASAAMATVTLRSEPRVHTLAFSSTLVPLRLGKADSLATVLGVVDRMPMGGTDVALPMVHATRQRLEVDTFVVYTDSETWFGDVHPARALQDYRQAMGIDARLIVVGMTATEFTVADPQDPGMLDVVGFDAAAPGIMADFARA